jgi:hypothetical protein
MKLSRLAVDRDGNLAAIVVTNVIDEEIDLLVRPLTTEELRKVVETYNAVADAAEGSNHLPYQMTFQLLRETDIAEVSVQHTAAKLFGVDFVPCGLVWFPVRGEKDTIHK